MVSFINSNSINYFSLKAMSEDSIKTAEEQLHLLITEANTVLIKLK